MFSMPIANFQLPIQNQATQHFNWQLANGNRK